MERDVAAPQPEVTADSKDLSHARRLLSAMLDDAALFPPGNAPMAAAVAAHDGHERAWYADLVGPFVCLDIRLDELAAVVAASPPRDEPLAVSVIVTGGAEAIGPAVDAIAADARLKLAAIEVAPPAGGGFSVTGVVEAAREAAQQAAPMTSSGIASFIEVARGRTADAALDAIAEGGGQVKLRTGGITAHAFPSERELAWLLHAVLDRGLAFKCTAGLHGAVRHTEPETRFEHHGFANLLLAVDAALAGAGVDDLAALLAERRAAAVASSVWALDAEAVAAVRERFASFGTCNVTDPIDDAVALGLLETTPG